MPDEEVVELSKNQLFDLHGADRFFIIESGRVNLFFIEMKEGQPIGRRTFFCSAKKGALLADFPKSESLRLYLSAEKKTSLRRIKSDAVTQKALFAWIDMACNHLSLAIGMRATVSVTGQAQYSLEENEVFEAEKKAICFVRIKSGQAKLQGDDRLLLNEGIFPLKEHLFGVATTPLEIEGVSAESVMSDGSWQEALMALMALVLTHETIQKERQQEEEKARYDDRKKDVELLLEESLENLTSVLNPMPLTGPLAQGGALYLALKLIGSDLGVSFKPLDEENLSPNEIIAAYCHDSLLRYRKVLLKGPWYKGDSGPMLAFYEDRPVALLRKGGSYYLHDPDNTSPLALDKEHLERLRLEAYVFYLPFDEKAQSGKDVFSFLLKKTRREYIPLLIYGGISAIIALFPPFATSVLFSKVIPETNISAFTQVSIGLIIAALSSSLFLYFRSLTMIRIEGLADSLIQSALWDRLLKLPVSFFRRYSLGDLFKRVMTMSDVRSLITSNVATVMISGIFSIFYLFAMFYYAPKLAFIGVGLMLLGTLVTTLCALYKMRVEKRLLQTNGHTTSLLLQLIGGVAKLRVSGSENHAFARWSSYFSSLIKDTMRSTITVAIAHIVNGALPLITYFFLFIAALGFYGKTLTLSHFLAFNVAFLSFSAAILELNNTIISLISIIPNWQRSKVIMEEPLESSSNKKQMKELSGEIHLDEVSFRYSASDPLILTNLTIASKPGECIGIVGPSGCGKSTLVRLLLGFEKPEQGAIYYDGNDIDSVDLHSMRKQVGIVLQSLGIYAGSIYDNIVCGGIYSEEEVFRALKIADFEKELETFPMGLHTVVPTNGETLSGGQKQRLMIARAVIGNPRILIMDEATSALDNQTQERITKNLEALSITRISIAHRLSTIRSSDRIYVMEKGQVVDSGTFDELAKRCPLFASMLERQAF